MRKPNPEHVEMVNDGARTCSKLAGALLELRRRVERCETGPETAALNGMIDQLAYIHEAICETLEQQDVLRGRKSRFQSWR